MNQGLPIYRRAASALTALALSACQQPAREVTESAPVQNPIQFNLRCDFTQTMVGTGLAPLNLIYLYNFHLDAGTWRAYNGMAYFAGQVEERGDLLVLTEAYDIPDGHVSGEYQINRINGLYQGNRTVVDVTNSSMGSCVPAPYDPLIPQRQF